MKTQDKALFSSGSIDFITKRMLQIIRKHNIGRLNNENHNLTDIQKEMISDFTISGAMSILSIWIKYDMDESPEKIAQLIVKLVFSGVNSVR